MFVLCDKCHNHYDDSSQTNKCRGPGTGRGHSEKASRPIHDHISAIHQTRGRGKPNPRIVIEQGPRH